MKKMFEYFAKTMMVLVLIAMVCGGVYGCYWVTKTVSYSFFYEDMVERTVVKMVKPEYLK